MSKVNQIMKYGHLIEYNLTNMFLQKSYIKCGGETNPRTFSKKSKLHTSLDQQSEIVYYQNILKLMC